MLLQRLNILDYRVLEARGEMVCKLRIPTQTQLFQLLLHLTGLLLKWSEAKRHEPRKYLTIGTVPGYQRKYLRQECSLEILIVRANTKREALGQWSCVNRSFSKSLRRWRGGSRLWKWEWYHARGRGAGDWQSTSRMGESDRSRHQRERAKAQQG